MLSLTGVIEENAQACYKSSKNPNKRVLGRYYFLILLITYVCCCRTVISNTTLKSLK